MLSISKTMTTFLIFVFFLSLGAMAFIVKKLDQE